MKRKTIFEIIIHITFWLICLFFFVNNSFMRFPFKFLHDEYLPFVLIISTIYLNYYYLIPNYFTNQKLIKYLITVFLVVLIITNIEFLLIRNNIIEITFMADYNLQKEFLWWNFTGILYRNLLFFAFFTIFRVYRDAINAYKLLKEKAIIEEQQLNNEIEMVKSKINTNFFFKSLKGTSII